MGAFLKKTICDPIPLYMQKSGKLEKSIYMAVFRKISRFKKNILDTCKLSGGNTQITAYSMGAA